MRRPKTRLRKVRRRSVWNQLWPGALSRYGEAPSQELLDGAIWSSFPQDLQCQLVQFLPLTSLCRFRCVSKSLCSAMTIITPTSPEPWLILYNAGKFLICNGDRWRRFGLPATLEALNLWPVMEVRTSAGLVLCAHHLHLDECWLSVHNPFVPSCVRSLGPLADIRGLSVDSGMLSFFGIQSLPSTMTNDGKISFLVVCVTSGERVLVHVFDSRSWSWVVECARLPWLGTDEALCLGSYSTLLLQDERLYFITVSKNNTRSLKCTSIWNPQQTGETLATWTDLPLNLHQNGFEDSSSDNHPSLISCRGKLMLVNVTPSPPYGAIGFVYLHQETREWRELTSLPLQFLPDEVKKCNLKANFTMSVQAAGERESSRVQLHFVCCHWGCIFDLADSTWRPALPSPDYGTTFMPFHPSFLTI